MSLEPKPQPPDGDLVAYLDDSGTDDQTPVAVAGCYIANHDEWKAFAEDWAEANKRYGFGFFHMADFVAHAKQFVDWDNDKRHEVICSLVSIINKRILQGFIGAVVKADYDVVPDDLRERLGRNHYSFAVRQCTAMIKPWRERLGMTAPITYIFEAGSKGNSEIRQVMESASQQAEINQAFGIVPGGFAFAPKRDAVQFQASDILAWESCWHMKRSVLPIGGPAPAKRASFRELLKAPIERAFFNETNLRVVVERMREEDKRREPIRARRQSS